MRLPIDVLIRHDPQIDARLRDIQTILARMETTMATKDQLDKLRVDVAALIDKAVKVITEAIAEAQQAPPDQADPAVDALDATVTQATQTLADAATKLRNPPA